MKLSGEQVKKSVKRRISRQKRNVKYRVAIPFSYCLDLARAKVHAQSLVSRDGNEVTRVALISDLDAPSSEQQFHPFSTHRAELRKTLGLISVQLMLKDVLLAPRLILSNFDIVIVKLSYRTTPSDALDVIVKLRTSIGIKRLIYFDGDDDLCIQWPNILQYVDLYVKKHALRDRTQYLRTFVGKSNLHDYVCHNYNHVLTVRDYGNPWEARTMITQSGPVPASQLKKLYVGIDLAEDSVIRNLYQSIKCKSDIVTVKDLDIVFRGAVTKETIIYYLRRDIEPILRNMDKSYQVTIPDRRVSRDDYYMEMMRSRICISPFGYGEICWRDYESILCRCLLIKPEMGHVETNPNIFQPFITYVPVKWDFSDLQEKCEYFMNNEGERQRIATAAYDILDEFYRSGGFIKSMLEMIRYVRSLPMITDAHQPVSVES